MSKKQLGLDDVMGLQLKNASATPDVLKVVPVDRLAEAFANYGTQHELTEPTMRPPLVRRADFHSAMMHRGPFKPSVVIPCRDLFGLDYLDVENFVERCARQHLFYAGGGKWYEKGLRLFSYGMGLFSLTHGLHDFCAYAYFDPAGLPGSRVLFTDVSTLRLIIGDPEESHYRERAASVIGYAALRMDERAIWTPNGWRHASTESLSELLGAALNDQRPDVVPDLMRSPLGTEFGPFGFGFSLSNHTDGEGWLRFSLKAQCWYGWRVLKKLGLETVESYIYSDSLPYWHP